MIENQNALTADSFFVGYSYSYPHKSAYRAIEPAAPLQSVWRHERRDALFLYLHVPFCEYRCGFCNLFTLANSEVGLVGAYLKQLRAEASVVGGVLTDARFARVAIGGGTPTFLNEWELGELLEIATRILGGAPFDLPTSCEASPATLTDQKARLLREWGVDRLSLGVQTFDDRASQALGRPQRAADVYRAIDVIRKYGFPVMNLDLIYGSPEETLASWLRTVVAAIETRAEEIYLYPLYVRELTGLGRVSVRASDQRIELYRAARDILLAAGYSQSSLRMFHLPAGDVSSAPAYCCQSDGMVGFGCGARSYASALHYSTEFAVGRAGVRSILLNYLKREERQFGEAQHGYVLNAEEQQRRYVIQSLLQTPGISRPAYARRFTADVLTDLPQLGELEALGLAELEEDRIQLTAAGLERSDVIGPWLYSPRVQALMEEYACH
jgi:oxygen-independent coproporphyrinogen-3 oxidase